MLGGARRAASGTNTHPERPGMPTPRVPHAVATLKKATAHEGRSAVSSLANSTCSLKPGDEHSEELGRWVTGPAADSARLGRLCCRGSALS